VGRDRAALEAMLDLIRCATAALENMDHAPIAMSPLEPASWESVQMVQSSMFAASRLDM